MSNYPYPTYKYLILYVHACYRYAGYKKPGNPQYKIKGLKCKDGSFDAYAKAALDKLKIGHDCTENAIKDIVRLEFNHIYTHV